VKVDIDEQLEAAKACNITSIPALVAFVDGRPVSQIVGAVPRARVRKLLDPLRSR
jgi:putative thioredoxin